MILVIAVATLALVNIALVVNTLRAYNKINELERECNLRTDAGGNL